MFEDRTEAGNLLVRRLSSSKEAFDLVLAIPRGGVIIGKILSAKLHKPLGVVNVKKIVTPGDPELARGAYLDTARIKKFGKTPDVAGKSILLTDDGIATGETVKFAINYLKKKGTASITLAVPVAPKDVFDELNKLVDLAVVLEVHKTFHAVGEFYNHFPQVSDEEVLQLLQ